MEVRFGNPATARLAVAPRSLLLLGAALVGAASPAFGQVTFSIGHRGPTVAAPDSMTGTCISPADILGPPAPALVPVFAPPALPFPAKIVPDGFIPFPGLAIPTATACMCAPPGSFCPIELDALSYGMDVDPATFVGHAGRWVFSVDEFATGIPGVPLAPNVTSEGSAAVIEAAGDVFESLGVPPGPLPPPPGPGSGNTGLIDGNGFVSPSGARYPGVGVIEPIPPAAGPVVPGDNLDALDLDTPFGTFPVYYSLDAAFPDPLRGIPNLGTGPANGFAPGAVVMTPAPGAAPILYAPAAALGLDLFGPGTDDLDALVLIENGVPGLQVGPGGDVLYFSVRRFSAVIGVPDSLFGIPIEEGDILTFPAVAGAPPAIHIAAEWLGLVTARSFGVVFGDDLDALDTRAIPVTGVPFCIGDGAAFACFCGNPGAPPNGCANSLNPAGANLAATGAANLGADTVVLTASGMPPTALCIFIQSPLQIAPVPFGDGMRCLGGVLKRMAVKAAAAGTAVFPSGADPSVSARSAALGDPIPPFAFRYYQTYYRNPPPFACPSPATFNITNALAIQWFP